MIAQFLKYCTVGAMNTAFGLSVIYALMAFAGFSPAIANAAGFAAAFVLSYIFNRRWTFRSEAPIARSLTGFVVVCAAGYVLNLAVTLSAIHLVGLNPYLAQLCGVGLYALFVFAISRRFVFPA